MLRPIAGHLEQADPDVVLLSMDQELRYIPVAALHDGTQWVAQRWPTAVITPSSTMHLDQVLEGAPRVAALGLSESRRVGDLDFPALGQVPAELAAVREQVPGEVFQDAAFTKEGLGRALRSDAPWVHIASHFHLEAAMDDSFLLLADGPMTLAELGTNHQQYPLLDLDLLVLSACNTAVGTFAADGAEIEGLASVAQQGGAWSVLATLWPVADRSTATWMAALYQHRNQGVSKAEAIQKVQLAFIAGEHAASAVGAPDPDRSRRVVAGPRQGASIGWAHPFYWAPFVLMGAW